MRSIKILDEDKAIIEKIAEKEHRFQMSVLSDAIRNYAKSKRIFKDQEDE